MGDLKDVEFCTATIGKKTDPANEVLKGWGYGNVDGVWHEIYSRFKCEPRSKITMCEVLPSNATLCEVRRDCETFIEASLDFYDMYKVPDYPLSSAGSSKRCGEDATMCDRLLVTRAL